MKKYREDLELIRLSKEGDMKAQYELWKKWEPFTSKRYFQSLELYQRVRMSYEDFMQEAYLAFISAIDHFTFDKATGTNFSTVYYWYLVKVRNTSERYERRYGNIALETDIRSQDNRGDSYKEDSMNDRWNKATLKDITADFKQAQAVEVIEIFFEEEENPILKNVLTLMLQGNKTKAILEFLGEGTDLKAVKGFIREIKRKLKAIGERVMFEPISVRG